MRILSIDGGGVRGIVPAAILAYWEREQKGRVADRFDFFAGTSTGAIVAASLAAGLSAETVFDLFVTETEGIFKRGDVGFWQRALSYKGWALPAYSSDRLRTVLESHLADMTLGECPRPLVVTSLDVVNGIPKIFRSGHHPQCGSDRDVRLVDAVLASSAAPVFFPSVRAGASTYVDGAMWANNPSLVALLESQAIASGEPNLVSISCGHPIWSGRLGFGGKRGLVGWSVPFVTLMITAQADGVHSYMQRLVPPERYCRIDPTLPRHLASIESAANQSELVARAQEAARGTLGLVAERFPLVDA